MNKRLEVLTMNSAEKVFALVNDKDFKLATFARQARIPFNTLRNYRKGIDHVNKAQWYRVEQLAQVYDKWQEDKKQ